MVPEWQNYCFYETNKRRQDGDIYKICTNGSERQAAFDTNFPTGDVESPRPPKLFIWQQDNSSVSDLWLCEENSSRILQEDFTTSRRILQSTVRRDGLEDANEPNELRYESIWTIISDLRDKDTSSIELSRAYEGEAGLTITDSKSNKAIRLMIQTPLLIWRIKSITILPGDQLVCELSGQIVIMDLRKKKMGLLALGLSPVVILE